MQKRWKDSPVVANNRRGSIAPLAAVALVVGVSGIALALDRAWIDIAQVELTTATDAAALAAARELVGDDLLRPGSDVAARVSAARAAAIEVASLNTVIRQPVTLHDSDITFGRLVYDSSSDTNVFLQTELVPRTVVVTGIRERSRSNPIALVMRGLAGRSTAELGRWSAATVDNRLVGVRAATGLVVPAMPLAILGNDPTGARFDTWQFQIGAGQGTDNFGYDATTHSVTAGPDGIREIVLTGSAGTTTGKASNMCLVDFSGTYDSTRVYTMILHGWTKNDLAPLRSGMTLASLPISVAASSVIAGPDGEALAQMIGECRICLLYRPVAGSTAPIGKGQVSITGLVAGRIMSLVQSSAQALTIVFQPGVLVTRAAETVAEIDSPADAAQSTVTGNPYIFKMTLTH
jgi:hypothetical protein